MIFASVETRHNMKRIILLFSLFVIIASSAQVSAQLDTISSVFGKGIRFVARDSSFYVKFGFRIQPNFTARYTDAFEGEPSLLEQRFVIRRSRLKLDGWAFSPKLAYKFEYDLVGGFIRDAVVKWNFAGKFKLWVGQAKLPGNRQRVISSQKQQFVERSLMNIMYNIDRDVGVQLHHDFMLGKSQIKWALSVAQGDGIIYKGWGEGLDYTARLEWLPFGKFMKNGDYFEADLLREQTPKLAIGATYDFNEKAFQDRGQWGFVLEEERDMQAIFVDAILKYRGISVLGEYSAKSTPNGSPAITDTTGAVTSSFITGTGYNVQLGYVFKCNWEVAGRYSIADYEEATERPDEAEYTFAISKYLVGHSLKIQFDTSLLTEVDNPDTYRARLQMELAF